jgi:hypothetical protein
MSFPCQPAAEKVRPSFSLEIFLDFRNKIRHFEDNFYLGPFWGQFFIVELDYFLFFFLQFDVASGETLGGGVDGREGREKGQGNHDAGKHSWAGDLDGHGAGLVKGQEGELVFFLNRFLENF